MGLRSDILNHQVSALPMREGLIVAPDARLGETMQKMQAAHLGCVVVVDERGRPLGKFTERRLMRLVVAGKAKPDTRVGDHVFGAEDCVTRNDPIHKMIRIMEDRQLRFIIVVDEQGRVIGLTGQKGLMEYIAEHFPRQVKVQRMQAKLHMDEREGA